MGRTSTFISFQIFGPFFYFTCFKAQPDPKAKQFKLGFCRLKRNAFFLSATLNDDVQSTTIKSTKNRRKINLESSLRRKANRRLIQEDTRRSSKSKSESNKTRKKGYENQISNVSYGCILTDFLCIYMYCVFVYMYDDYQLGFHY